MAGGARKAYYLGDVLGYRDRERLMVTQLSDPSWPYRLDSAFKPFIQIQRIESGSIEWSGVEDSYTGIDHPDIDQTVLLDRPFVEIGAEIRRNGMTGKIKEKREVATVRLMNDSAFIRNVPLERLMEISNASIDRQVLFRGYIGDIETVTHKIKMIFPNSNTCSIDYQRNEPWYIGCEVNPTFQDLKRAKWIGGSLIMNSVQILRNIAKTAKVTDIEVESLMVNWVSPLAPTTVEDHPPRVLTRNHIQNVQYLPHRCGTPKPLNICKMEITEEDLENLFDTNKKFLNNVLNLEDVGNDDNDENEEGRLEKRQRLDFEARQVGSVQPVLVLLLQSMVQIEYEGGLVEEIPSTELDEILSRNSVDIPRREYFLRVDETDGYMFGLDTNYFLGETEHTPMNPLLNPDNIKNIRWFKVNKDNLTDVQGIGYEEMSTFDLKCLGLSMSLEKSDYVTRGFGTDEFEVGSFTRILENGKIEIKDSNGNLFERWITEISIPDDPEEILAKICVIPPQPNPAIFHATHLHDLTQTSKILSSTSLYGLDHEQPVHSASFFAALRHDLDSLLDTANPLYDRTWIKTYKDRPDVFTGFLLGQKGGILEDLLFLIDIHFPPDYPSASPVFSLNPYSTAVDQEYLNHWEDIMNLSFVPLEPKTTILQDLQVVRDYIESTSIGKIRYEGSWCPIDYFYPEIDFTPEQQKAWQQRWHEVICVQSMRYVFKQIAFPADGPLRREILGHYRRVLPDLMNRWRNWTVEQSDLFSGQSHGFILAVQNQLTRFQLFISEAGDEASGTESNDEFELNVESDNNLPVGNPNGPEDNSINVLLPPN